MINYIEKGSGLHRVLAEAGFQLVRLDGVWQPTKDDAAVQAIIDSFDPNGPDGAPERREYMDEIDRMAGEARKRFITDVPGQQAVYLTKAQEARALRRDPLALTPHLTAEAGATRKTVAQIAARVEATETLWATTLSPAIEAVRMKYKGLIEAQSFETHAGLIEEARIAFDAIR